MRICKVHEETLKDATVVICSNVYYFMSFAQFECHLLTCVTFVIVTSLTSSYTWKILNLTTFVLLFSLLLCNVKNKCKLSGSSASRISCFVHAHRILVWKQLGNGFNLSFLRSMWKGFSSMHFPVIKLRWCKCFAK